MAFVTISSSAIQTGEPVTSAIATQMKDNEDDLNSRITTLEGTTNIFPPLVFEIPHPGKIEDGASHYWAPFDMTLLGIRVRVVTAGASGSVTIDVEKKHGGGGFSTVLSSTIVAAAASGDYFTVSGTIADSSVLSGDILRINVDTLQLGQGDVQVYIEYEKT